MADENELGRETVVFEAAGLEKIIQSTEKLEELIKNAYAEQVALNERLNDPSLDRRRASVQQLKNETERLSNTQDAQAESGKRASQSLGSEYRKRLAEVSKLHRGLDRMDAAREAHGNLASNNRGDLLGRIADLRESREYQRQGGLLSHVARSRIVERAEAVQTLAARRQILQSGEYLKDHLLHGSIATDTARLGLAERQTILNSGQYLKDRDQAGSIAHDTARIGLAERQAILNSGQYLKDRDQAGSIAHDTARIGLAERQAAIASGLLAKEAALEGKLRSDIQRLANLERQTILNSGQFSENVRQQAVNKSQVQQLERAERREELRIKHGGYLGSAIYGLERARPGMLAAGAIGGIGIGMAKSGFSGTIEGRTFEMELHLLNRELAAALVPVLKDLTSGIRWLRHQLERLTPGQQNVIGYGIAGAAGLGALGLAANGISGAIGGIGALLRMTGLRGAATAAMPSVTSQIAAQAAGSAAGGLAAGAGTTIAGGAAVKGARASRMGRLAGAGRGLAKAGPWAFIGASILDAFEGDYYARERGRGNNKFLAGVAALAGGTTNMLSQPLAWTGIIPKSYSEMFSEKYAGDINKFRRNNEPGKHRGVTIADAGFEDFDTSYRRVATAAALQMAIEQEPGGKLAEAGKDNTSGGKTTPEWLETIAGILGGTVPQFGPILRQLK